VVIGRRWGLGLWGCDRRYCGGRSARAASSPVDIDPDPSSVRGTARQRPRRTVNSKDPDAAKQTATDRRGGTFYAAGRPPGGTMRQTASFALGYVAQRWPR